jgi:hypothetical protein
MAQQQNIWSNMLGQQVDISNPDTASGYYLATDAAWEALEAAGQNTCPQGMRPGRMVIKGVSHEGNNYIRTCAGRISQEDMPDIHIVDWPYRIYIDMVLAVLVLAVAAGIFTKALTR